VEEFSSNEPVMNDEIKVRLHDSLGCNIVSTALLKGLNTIFPKSKLAVYTKFQDLVKGLPYIDTVHDIEASSREIFDIDLKDYLKIRCPQENLPYRHLLAHQIEIAEEQLQLRFPPALKSFRPMVFLSNDEKQEAQNICTRLSDGKPLVFLQTKTAKHHKNWKDEAWIEIKKALPDYAFIDLSQEEFSRRTAMAITKYCHSGIVLDSFLLHGSYAVGAKNVIAVMVSSHPEVVTYSNQYVVNATPFESAIERIRTRILHSL